MKAKTTSCTSGARNDRVDGLKAAVTVKNGKKTTVLSYTGKYGQGYDGCGTHTHK